MSNRLFLVLKFGEEKYLQMMQKGQLFCRNANFYAQCEKKDGDIDRGDKYECKDVMTNLKGTLLDDNGNVIISFNSGEMVQQDKNFNKVPIFCSYGITLDDIDPISEDEESVTFEFKYMDIFKDTFKKEYWSHVLMVAGGDFMKKAKAAAINKNIFMSYGEVKYYDSGKTPIEKEEELEEDFSNIAFWKLKNYKDQNEFRLVLKNQRIEDDNEGYIYDVGDLSYCSKIFTLEELKDKQLRFNFKKKVIKE